MAAAVSKCVRPTASPKNPPECGQEAGKEKGQAGEQQRGDEGAGGGEDVGFEMVRLGLEVEDSISRRRGEFVASGWAKYMPKGKQCEKRKGTLKQSISWEGETDMRGRSRRRERWSREES